jgi:hypothetical protein
MKRREFIAGLHENRGPGDHLSGVLSSMLAHRAVRPARNADGGSALIAGKKRGAGVGTACAPGDPAKAPERRGVGVAGRLIISVSV